MYYSFLFQEFKKENTAVQEKVHKLEHDNDHYKK